MTPTPSSEGAILSARSASALRDAFRQHLTAPSEATSTRVAEAMSLVCAEARRDSIPAEQLLVAFKGIWSALPEVRRLTPDRAADQVRALVTLCIEHYYGEPRRPES